MQNESMLTYSNDIMVEIKERTASGNRCLKALNSIMKARYISKKVKIREHKTVIKPLVAYGSETWTLSEQLPPF
jgi:hypothetical protein